MILKNIIIILLNKWSKLLNLFPLYLSCHYKKKHIIMKYSVFVLSYFILFLTTRTMGQSELSGQLSGIINTGTYIVVDSLEVANTDTLVIEPGVVMLFYQDIPLDVYGLLIAEGTETDSIIFTRFENSVTWGGINFFDSSDSSSLSYCIIEFSNSSGIFCFDTDITITNSSITNNNSGGSGGGIYMQSSNPILRNVVVANNTAGNGGGIWYFYSFGTMTNMIIINNSANSVGGIMCASFSAPIITNSIISNNSATNTGGGGIKCQYYAAPVIINSVIDNNYAETLSSGGIYCLQNCSLTIINSIITNNTGYGINDRQNTCYEYIINSNIWGNTDGSFNNCGPSVGNNVSINTNGDSIDSYGNIQLDPMYLDLVNENYHLLSESPCIDAGLNDSVIVSYDFDGNIRMWDGNNDGDTIVDIGPFEFGAPLDTTSNTYIKERPAPKYKIFPNPSSGVIKIINNSKENYYVEILNITGQIIFKTQLGNGNITSIDLSDQPKGLYLIRLFNDVVIKTEKVIIQ